MYPDNADKQYKNGLRKSSKNFVTDAGRLFYVGGSGKEKSCLVVENVEERKRIISSIHDLAHLGRDKTLSEITEQYY